MTTISMEEYELMKDSKYRMYVAAIDKALKNFDYTSEWADLISALGKLNKVLTSYQKFRVIPRRIKISKRLAQCMHPALPSGVHLKALETYDIIFRTIGTARLSQELFIYSSGLFPLLGHAAMNIRPALLSMYETHFVPLHERLRPALIGFLSGVLPGLESGSDHFERTNQLLENVCDGVGPKYFYTCIWHCVTNNSPVRLPAISYVLTHYKRKFVMEDQLYLMGHDIDLMVSGLCAAVQDTNILVQRSALDLLMVCFPMQNKQLLYADMVRLVTAALTTILRRDMSLNRRLYSWLLEKEGTIPIVHIEDEIDDDVNHVHSTIAYDLLNDAIRIILKNSSMEIQLDIKPYRLLTSLFDKPQIGPIILDNILYDVFRALYLSCLQQQKHKSLNNGGNNGNNYNYINGNTASITTTTTNTSTVRCVSFNGDLTSLKNHDDIIVNKQFIMKNCQELIKNANLLFNTLHSFYIWSYIEKLYSDSIVNIKNYKTRDRWQVNDIGCGLPNILEICLLTDFLLDIIPIESLAENTSNILPNLFNKIIIIMKLNMDILNHLEIEKSLELCTKILTKIQPLTLATTTPSTTTAATTSTTTQIIKDDTEIDSTTPTTTTANNSDDKSVTISLSNDNDNNNNNGDNDGLKTSLEKSKSDSKLNENFGKNELTIDDNTRERSYSNQMLKKKDKSSPKIDKKSKNKKSKSSSKLYDLKKDENEIDETTIVESEITTKTTTNIRTTTTTRTATNGNKSKTENNKFFLKCLEEYKDFYVVFIKIKILPNVNIKQFLSTLIIDKNERTNSLYKMLEESLQKQDNFVPIDYRKILMKTNHKISDDGTTTSSSDDDHDDNHVIKYESAMSVASNILLEFSAFPNIISNNNNHYYCGNNDKKIKLPKWLQSLLVTVCCKESTRDIQIIAMNTLLEIFSLSKNQKFVKHDDNDNVDDGTNIFITGILENVYVNFIEENTIILEQMSQILWNTLRIASTQKQLLQCVTLLYQIHNIFDNRIVVEEVIGKYLVAENITVEYMKEFFLLWHLGRDLNIKLPPNRTSIRSFDRSLLKILDNLQNPEEPDLQLLSETFLNHSILHNDISRIINPILIKLLTPNTARVSIRHININDNDIQNEINSNENRNKIDENQSKKIYAISNENGNIMYHLTNNTTDLIKQQQSTTLLSSSTSINNSSNNNTGGSNGSGSGSSKRKWFTFSKTGKKYSPTMVNVTTSIDDFNNIVTRKNRNDYKNYKIPITPPPPINHRIINNNDNKNNVKVIINPLSSKEIYSDGLDGSYSKIDSQPSSTDSLNSSICGVIDTKITNNDRDSGYESSILMKTKLLESIEPISDGVKDDQQTVVNNNNNNNNCNNNKIPKSHSFDEKCVNQKINDLENSSLVHSWSYCISDSDNLNAELEISTSAEEFFKKSDNIIINDIINEIIDKVCNTIDDDDENDKNIINYNNNNDSINNKRPTDLDLKTKSKNFVLYPIHSHICLYYEIFDSEQILYAIQTLKNCLNANPKLFIKCLATSGIKDLKNNDILYLLAKHRKSLLGYSFIGELNHEYVNFYRGYMFLDIIILICLNYSRTFYPPYLDDLIINKYNDINNNHKIQLECLELLNLIIKNLIEMVKENTKGFSIYIADMLVKCKLQKIILHCLLTSVRNFDDDDMTFAEQVLLFNNFQLYDRHMKVGEYVEAYQIRILRLVHSLIILEYYVYPQTKSLNNSNQESNNTTTKNVDLNYTPTILIPQQNIFLSAVMSALRHENMKNLHNKWLNMITSCLPYFGENIKQITISCIHQICNIIENISVKYNYDELDDNELCTDYAVTLLESLTILCHYCLLDPSQTVNQINIPILNATTAQSSTTPTTNPGEIFNNLVSAFFSPDLLSTTSTTTTTSSSSSSSTSASTAATTTQTITTVLMKQNNEHYQNARKTILSHMPRIISSVAKLWQTIVTLENDNNSIYGNTKIVKQQLLEFLSPISVHHGNSFLAAIAVAWYERRNLFTNIKTVLPEPNAGQNNLVYLISAIRVIPLDNLVQTVTAVIKNPPPIDGLNADICLDVSVLELFYCYMRNASATQLSEAWSSLLALIREGSSLSPPAQFLLAALLHELMIKCCPLEERKDQKDLQDVTAKLIESVSQVCGSCLEQTTWLRRNLAVKELDETLTNDTNNLIGTNSEIIGNSYSVQAQLVLAEILAPILDICFGSSEKDKVITILTSLMYNIVPYLKTHTTKNMSSFLACSKLLASLSSYQYTRKAWKKDVFDLLLDNSLFQMDYNCLKYWRIIVDNLMTHDNTTFRDLMSRVSLTQSGSLSLFSSREQEYELRAQLLKRLAYVIFCSEMDQYAKYMPDIQEQLTASLRLNVPGVQAQVFLCFRVILIRMSPIQVTSLWPIIISEMLQVFLQIEQELSTDTEEFSSHIKLLSTLDASWSTNSNNGLHALGHPHWLKLQLSTAKLLDLVLLLPAISLPQFQMYRWAFVGDDLERLDSLEGVPFIPHVVRIAELMDRKFTDTQIETLPMKRNELLLTMNHIDQLKDLHSFFKTLSLCSNKHRTEYCKSGHVDYTTAFGDRQSDKKLSAILEKIDKVIEMDFLDKISR